MVTYYETVGSQSTSSASFSMEGARATMVLDVAAADANDAIIDLLGDCTRGQSGKLNRTLPKAHPDFPWLYASRISSMVGLKPTASKTAADAVYDAEALPYFQSYTKYRLTVEFEPRPYAVRSDDAIWTELYGYYQDSDTSSATGTGWVASEWLRFTDIQVDAQPQLLTVQQGQMVFETLSGTSPNGKTFSQFPRLYLPDGKVVVRWFQIPESYVRSTNSHLRKWIGRINQTAWLDWQKGELLYLGFTQRRYTPPVPALDKIDLDATTFSTEKLCDIEMTFAETKRTGADLPTSVNSGSWIVGGHNLHPLIEPRGYYYARVDTGTAANKWPLHQSFEVRLLFSDPDA